MSNSPRDEVSRTVATRCAEAGEITRRENMIGHASLVIHAGTRESLPQWDPAQSVGQ